MKRGDWIVVGCSRHEPGACHCAGVGPWVVQKVGKDGYVRAKREDQTLGFWPADDGSNFRVIT